MKFIRQSPISFIKNEARTYEGPLRRPDELWKTGAIFQVSGQCSHEDTHTHINTEGILSEHSLFERQSVPKRVRDEKEVREAKASRPRERD